MAQKHPAQKHSTNPEPVQEAPTSITPQSATRKWLPHAIAVVIFFLVTVSYFSPMIFGNKEIFQEDIMRARGISKAIADFRTQYHEEPLWADALFCGMPAYQISTYYLANNLEYVQKLFSLFLPHPIR